MAAADPNILYAFLAFMSLMLVAMFGFMVRLSISVGRIEGQLNGLTARVERLEQEMVRLREQLDNFREQIADLREQVAEVRGMLLAVNRNIDLLMRHHHNDAGQVVIVPAEEVAAD